MVGDEEPNPSTFGTVNPVQAQHKFFSQRFDAVSGSQSADPCPKLIRRSDRYRIAPGLSNKPNKQTDQVSTLLCAMGDSADDILQTLRIEVLEEIILPNGGM